MRDGHRDGHHGRRVDAGVQALSSTTIFPCYAPEDREWAAQTADFLQKGADVRVFLDEGECARAKICRQGARGPHGGGGVGVLFAHFAPARWPRSQWEDALVNEPAAENVRIAFLKCDDCLPPRVLANQFDLTARRLDGLRGLKRWIRCGTGAYKPPGHDVELLAIAIADRPGMETVNSIALAEAATLACAQDFDATLRLHCPGRTLTALAGDLGWQLGLKLEGELESNLERLENFCTSRRLLVLLEAPEDAVAEALVFGGRCSTLISTEAGPALADPLHEAQRALNGGVREWTDLCRLARLGRQLTANRGRIAECYELMRQWNALAEQRGDRAAANESMREMVWILEGWGRREDALELEYQRAREYDEQMKLF